MPSELKSATSRANGAKSRGPKTAETRERSSRNSLRHGIVARKTILLECEDPDQFQAMIDEYGVTYQPGNAIEQDLIDEMVASRWRSGRLSMIVTSLLDMQMNQQGQPAPPTKPDPARPVATAFKSLADESKALALALRYESRLRRIHERAFATLRELQRERKTETANQEPVVPDPDPRSDVGQDGILRPIGNRPPATDCPSQGPDSRSAARCAPKKIFSNEPTNRYALKTFHPPRRGSAAAEAAS